MSKKYSRTLAPLVLDLTPSRWLRSFHATVAVTALVAIGCTPFSWTWQLFLASAVLGFAYRTQPVSRIHRLQFDQGWRGLMLPDRELHLQLDSAVVWPMLIVLHFSDRQAAGSRWRRSFPLVLLPDSVDLDSWRRLRLFLNHIDVFGSDDVPAIHQRDR